MKLAIGLKTVENFETGEYSETYDIVYETKTYSRHLEALKWFAKSKYKKVLVVPDYSYRHYYTLRSALAERMGHFVQPDDCFISIVEKNKRVYFEKT